jgi:phage terminase small subunit
MPALSEKQKRFVSEYLIDLNATQAAIRTGYSARTAQEQGSRLLSNAMVQAALAERQRKLAAKFELTQERVVAELVKIGFSDIRKIINWRSNVTSMVEDEETGESRMAVTNEVQLIGSHEIDDDTAAAISEISQTDKGGLKVKLHDKKGALIDLGKHLGMFKDQVEHSGNVSIEVVRFSDAK